MQEKLSHLANVFTGHTLRGKMQHDPNGDCTVIQLKDLLIAGSVSLKHPPYKTSLGDIPAHQVLKKGDILIISKGSGNKALLYDGQYAPAVAVSAFAVIRPTKQQLKAEFLTWYINSSGAQEYFNAQRAGTTTLNLPKKAIDDLLVPVPSLEKQELMMKLVTQYEIYKGLVAEYEHNTRLLVEQTLHNHLNESYK